MSSPRLSRRLPGRFTLVALIAAVQLDALPAASAEDPMGARAAFAAAARVFAHPRCTNCHAAGDSPLQGNLGRPHAMLVRRGPDGAGTSAMRCGNCHQPSNQPAAGAPPGAPGWHMPHPDSPMVFEGRAPARICRQLKDPEQNGGRMLPDIVEHVSRDPLVLWAWSPGAARERAPGTPQDFVDMMREWVARGAACPQ